MSWENFKANNGSNDHYNQLEKVETNFIVNKEVIKKNWKGINPIPNPFGALGFNFIAKGSGIYHKTSNFEKKLEVDTFFQDMTLILFANYFSIPGAPPVKCQLIESKKIQLKPHPIFGHILIKYLKIIIFNIFCSYL